MNKIYDLLKCEGDMDKSPITKLRQLEKLKKDILSCINHGTIDYAGAATQTEMIKNQELKLKQQLINTVHVTKWGIPRKIEYKESKDLWMTIMPDKSKVYAKTKLGLYDKLLDVYVLKICDTTINGVFEAAIDEKARTENNDESTISHYRYDYNRFITPEFGKRDVTKVTKAELKEYTQNMVNTLHPKKKAFLLYKGVLNLIFRYALEYDLIAKDPVTAIKNAVYLKSCDTRTATAEEKILSEDEIELVKAKVRQRMKEKRYHGYFINGYAILLSIETGLRAAELPALKWSDVHDEYIHIHAQQLQHVRKGYTEYYYAGWTKNEKGVSQDGRKYPLTDAIEAILCVRSTRYHLVLFHRLCFRSSPSLTIFNNIAKETAKKATTHIISY